MVLKVAHTKKRRKENFVCKKKRKENLRGKFSKFKN